MLELLEFCHDSAGGGVIVAADETGEAEEIEDPPKSESAQGDPETNLGSGSGEVEVVPAEEEPREETGKERFLMRPEFAFEVGTGAAVEIAESWLD